MTEEQTEITLDEIDDLERYRLGETAQELILNSREHHISVTDHMAPQATHTIRIFTRDLDPVIYDRNEFVESCKSLALRSRNARIEILAFQSQRILQRGHRLVELARSLSSKIEIRRPEKEYERHLHAFITFDATGYIYRTSADRYEGIANYHDPRETREFEKLFAEIWQRSHVDTEMRRLNI
jgi:hypothetical protein